MNNSTPKNAKLIEVSGLTKRYKIGGQFVTVLDNIDLSVEEGEFLAVTGASGSGKSTLLHLMGGLDIPSSGKVSVDGVNIGQLKDSRLSEFRNRTIGFVFQFFYLQPFLNLRDNIAVPTMFASNDKERAQIVNELLQRVGLSDQGDKLPKQLSGGQIQRAAIARALINQPKLLLADEPTGNLDSANGAAIVELFKRIRRELNTTIVIVTHNQEIAAQADRELKMKDGALQ
jgi:ABC-type lipoprotein export system ATPase subunit